MFKVWCWKTPSSRSESPETSIARVSIDLIGHGKHPTHQARQSRAVGYNRLACRVMIPWPLELQSYKRSHKLGQLPLPVICLKNNCIVYKLSPCFTQECPQTCLRPWYIDVHEVTLTTDSWCWIKHRLLSQHYVSRGSVSPCRMKRTHQNAHSLPELRGYGWYTEQQDSVKGWWRWL